MEPTRPKLPSEAIELYNLFIHGEISRRDFMDGVQKFAVGGLAVAAIIEALMPNYALGQQVSKTDDRIKATYETVQSPQGNGSIKGYFVRPVSADTRAEKPVKLPGIIVVHENRGLNPHIEDIARRLALANFMVFAPDGLTSLGGFPGDDYRGGQMFSKVDGKKMAEDFVASAMWLKSRAGSPWLTSWHLRRTDSPRWEDFPVTIIAAASYSAKWMEKRWPKISWLPRCG